MSQYAILKAAIADDIKQNGANLITGELLQESLLSMINSLGAGYQFAGIARTATNPGTPDQNVFYLAGPGRYVNFGGLTVQDGTIGALKWNGSWSLESVVVNGESGTGWVPNLQDLILKDSMLQFADRAAATGQMGYKILRPDLTFAEQVTDANTIYEIRYPFLLNHTKHNITIGSGTSVTYDGVTYYYATISVPTGKTLKLLNRNLILLRAGVDYLGKTSTDGTAYIATTTPGTFNNAYAIQDNITIPNNCVLRFVGGMLSGGCLLGSPAVDAPLRAIFSTDMSFAGLRVAEGYPEWFGAIGDDSNDDTDAVQQCVEYCEVTRFSKTYKTTRTIIFPQFQYRNVYGSNPGAFGTGALNAIIGIHSSADIAMFMPYNSQRFYNSHLRDFAIRGDAGKSCGLKAMFVSNCTFSNLNIYGYTDGKGMEIVGANSAWGGQYSTIRECIFNLCKIGVAVRANGIVIDSCFFDGSDNFTQFTQRGFQIGSKGIHIIDGDSSIITNNRIQGWHIGVNISSSENKVANNRFEGNAIGVYVEAGQGNIIEKSNNFNNYIIAQKAGSSRYGVSAYVKGSKNVIENCVYRSSYGSQVLSGNVDMTGQNINIDIGTWKMPSDGAWCDFRLQLDDFNGQYGCMYDSIYFFAFNATTYKTNQANFQIQIPGAYIATNNGSGAYYNNAEDYKWFLALQNTAMNFKDFTTDNFIRFISTKDMAAVEHLRIIVRMKNYVSETIANNMLNLS